MEPIKGILHKNTTLGWAAAAGTGLPGVTFQPGTGSFVCRGKGVNEHNKFLCHIKCRLLALPGWPLLPIIREANALADMSIWMDEMFFSFADTGDHMPIIITMAIYTSLCKCLLLQNWLSGLPHISFVLRRIEGVKRIGGINSGLLGYHSLGCKGYTLKR